MRNDTEKRKKELFLRFQERCSRLAEGKEVDCIIKDPHRLSCLNDIAFNKLDSSIEILKLIKEKKLEPTDSLLQTIIDEISEFVDFVEYLNMKEKASPKAESVEFFLDQNTIDNLLSSKPKDE